MGGGPTIAVHIGLPPPLILKRSCLCLLAAALLVPLQSQAVLVFGNINVVQNDAGNDATSLTLSFDYRSSTSMVMVGANSSRGDQVINFGTGDDIHNGILMTSVSQLSRDNSATGDAPGASYATSSIATTTGNRYYIPVSATAGSAVSGGSEYNANVAAAYFSYADGWVGGHVRQTDTTANAVTPLDTINGSAGLTVVNTLPAAGASNYIYDDAATNGLYEVKLTGANSQTGGILLVNGGENNNRYALSRPNADGTWTVAVRANTADGATKVNGDFGFVYVPKDSVVESGTGVYAMGRVNGDLSRDIEGGNFVMVQSTTGTYSLYAPGLNSATSTLILSPEIGEVGGGGEDNVWTYGANGKGWTIQTRDLPSMTLQNLTATTDLFSFAIMSTSSTLAKWADGGGSTNWGTEGNWAAGAQPAAGSDVLIATYTRTGTPLELTGTKTVGMLTITAASGFTMSGGPLEVGTGIAVNSNLASAQAFTIANAVSLTNDAFIISQSLSASAPTLTFDVTTGNAVTGENKNLTLTGGAQDKGLSFIQFNDGISLGTGAIIKEGYGQATFNAANSYSGGTIIRNGPNTNTNGAMRINNAAAYSGFGSGDIRMENTTSITALAFGAQAGSGTLANNIKLQSTTSGISTRLTINATDGNNVTFSGLISGGHSGSSLLLDNDSNNDLGQIHLSNTANSFVASSVYLARGGLVIYGDGALGDASNDITLDVSSAADRTGLQFGVDNIVLNVNRSLSMLRETVIHSRAFTSTIEGAITGAGVMDKRGTGNLILNGNNSAYTGNINVEQGTLTVNGSLGDNVGTTALIDVKSGTKLQGNGTINRDVTVRSGATLEGGSNGTGALTISGSLNLEADSTVDFHLSGTTYDSITATDLIVTNGVGGVGGTRFKIFLDVMPPGIQSYNLFDWTNITYTGGADLADQLDLPILGEGFSWDTTQFNSTGVITLVPEPSRLLLLAVGIGCTLLRRRRGASM